MDLNALPLDVLLFILEVGEDVELVKNCRLVSKTWNDVSCRVLRKIAAAPLKEGHGNRKQLERFKDILLDRQFCFPPDWPTPFRNFKLLEASFSTPSFVRFIQRPIMRITSMEMIDYDEDKFNRAIFESILKKHQSSIRNLKFRCNCGFVTFVLGAGGQSLKSVTLKDTCGEFYRPCPLMEIIVKITANRSILQMDLDGNLTHTTKVFLKNKNQGSWDALRSLKLSSKCPPEFMTPEEIEGFMKWVQERKFPSLTQLKVWFSTDRNSSRTMERYTPYLVPLIQESSRKLDQLHSTSLRLGSLPSCPNLRFLSCALRDGDRIQDLTSSKFPSVISSRLFVHWGQVPTYSKIETDEKNLTLLSLAISWVRTTPKAAVETLWSSFGNQFPNLKKLKIIPNITCATLNSIRRRLPWLKDIDIQDISSNELLGTRSVASTREKGWHCKDVENCPLMEMTELTHLRFGEKVTISMDVVACLAKLPNIKVLSFYWNPGLQAGVTSELLEHVKIVRIFYKNKEDVRALLKLAEIKPNLELVEQS